MMMSGEIIGGCGGGSKTKRDYEGVMSIRA